MHVYETARLQLPGSRQAVTCPQCSTSYTALFQHSSVPPRFSPRSRSVCNAEARPGAGFSRQASISTNGSYDVRQATPDTGGTAGRRSQVAEQDVLPNGSIRPRVTPTVVRSYEVPLWDAMKFNGPGPEIINGRLAMIGILAAAVNESAHAETVVQQLPHVPVRTVALCLLVTYSSLIPILKGAKSEAFGIFTPQAELTNARAAMLGFAILLLLESKSDVPFF